MADLTQTTDARAWAEQFCESFTVAQTDGDGWVRDDRGLMLAWFANAIEVGRRAGRQETCPHADAFIFDDLRLCNTCGKNLKED